MNSHEPNSSNLKRPGDEKDKFKGEESTTDRLNNDDKTRESESSEKKQDSKTTKDFFKYAQMNKDQTITYLLLILGLIFLLFFNNLLGGLIIGMVAGYYFAEDIVDYLRNLGKIIGGQEKIHYVVLTALLLGLFIAAPGIFIGAIVVAAFKQILQNPKDSNLNK